MFVTPASAFLRKNPMNAKAVSPTSATKVADQIANFVKDNSTSINDLKYGEVRLMVRDGVIYQMFVSHSLIVKEKGT